MTQGQRALLAGVLSLAVFFLWQEFYLKKQLPEPGVAAPAPLPQVPVAPGSPPPGVPMEMSSGPSLSPEVRYETETDLYRAEWSSHGGRPRAFFLKGYRQGLSDDSPPINLIPAEGERALSLVCVGCNFDLPDEGTYRLVSESANEIVFEAATSVVRIRKTTQWDPSSYLLGVKISLQDLSQKGIRGKVGLSWRAGQYPGEKKGPLGFLKGPANRRALVSLVGGKVEHLSKEGQEVRGGSIPWAGIDERYFLIALIARRLTSEGELTLQETADWLTATLVPGPFTVPAGGVYEERFSVYVGPKQRESLALAGVGLERGVDYGWFKAFAIPILKLLQVFHSVTRNWGIAIILLTIVVKLLMNPLTVRSMKQMKEMQRLQPRLAELKEKFKNDRQRLNMETMQLFKTHKVNPLGGCLPMVLQMPIYIALYKVLYNAIEIYHAPFVGFYRDLSAPDPYFILPILLGVAMVLQQKMTPSASADPAQRQMMMLMPVMFTAFMLFLPLGLVLYIFVNTAMSVAQQWMYQRDVRWVDLIRGKLPSRL